MIRLAPTSLALHSHDVPGYKYKMDLTYTLERFSNVYHVVTRILLAAQQAPNQKLKNVVINCHGLWGQLLVGENNSINTGNVGIMRLLNRSGQKVETIWIVACLVAGFNDGKYHYRKLPVKLGAHFCAEFAKAAGCFVVAPEKTQYVNPGFYLRLCPDNCIDNYEGKVFRWDANGNEQEFKP
jgi:hypothetical protein